MPEDKEMRKKELGEAHRKIKREVCFAACLSLFAFGVFLAWPGKDKSFSEYFYMVVMVGIGAFFSLGLFSLIFSLRCEHYVSGLEINYWTRGKLSEPDEDVGMIFYLWDKKAIRVIVWIVVSISFIYCLFVYNPPKSVPETAYEEGFQSGYKEAVNLAEYYFSATETAEDEKNYQDFVRSAKDPLSKMEENPYYYEDYDNQEYDRDPIFGGRQ